MLVSIVITNCNYADYLANAIDSALRQSYPDKEVIVVDDGSTDRSADIIARYGAAIVAHFQDNGGHCSAANAGFAISRGDVVVFLDADDFLIDGAIEALAEPLSRNPSVSKCQGYLQAIDISGRPTGRIFPKKLSPTGDYREETLRRGPGACRHALTSGNAWPLWFLRRVMPLPESRDLGVDGCLNSVSTLFGRTVSIDRFVAAYRMHDRNLGPTSTKFTQESLRKRLRQMEATQDYLAHWATQLGQAAAADMRRWSVRNWRHGLLAHTVARMEGSKQTDSILEFLLSPFYTSHTNWPKAVFLSATLCAIRLLPARPSLWLSRCMLKLPRPT